MTNEEKLEVLIAAPCVDAFKAYRLLHTVGVQLKRTAQVKIKLEDTYKLHTLMRSTPEIFLGFSFGLYVDHDNGYITYNYYGMGIDAPTWIQDVAINGKPVTSVPK